MGMKPVSMNAVSSLINARTSVRVTINAKTDVMSVATIPAHVLIQKKMLILFDATDKEMKSTIAVSINVRLAIWTALHNAEENTKALWRSAHVRKRFKLKINNLIASKFETSLLVWMCYWMPMPSVWALMKFCAKIFLINHGTLKKSVLRWLICIIQICIMQLVCIENLGQKGYTLG